MLQENKQANGEDQQRPELLNQKAITMIWKHIDQSLFRHTFTNTSAYKLWTKIKSMIQQKFP